MHGPKPLPPLAETRGRKRARDGVPESVKQAPCSQDPRERFRNRRRAMSDGQKQREGEKGPSVVRFRVFRAQDVLVRKESGRVGFGEARVE